uniref:Uncharacterized protein n=1 Tax=Candidatus Kentrum sp. LFY TaxID=2126342 RepID=A0A450UGR1_9GAMM|nr:MAG: hypothetical protein BECKLFY1418B_GA0070995_102812 [Candidatus Kentron sp. LFY]
MPIPTYRELIIGAVSAIAGGVFVWSLNKNVELQAQLTAIQTINPTINEALESSATAKERAEIALQDVRDLEKEAKKIVRDMKEATPLFAKIDDKMGELRSLSETVAKEAALGAINELSVMVPVDIYGERIEEDGADKLFQASDTCIIGEIKAGIDKRTRNQASICACIDSPQEKGRGWYCIN